MRRWFSGFLLIYDLFFIHIISDDELEELSLRGRGGADGRSPVTAKQIFPK